MTAKKLSGRSVAFHEPEPWPEPVSGSVLLAEIVAWLEAYILLTPGAAVAIAVWCIVTWLVADLYFAPILALVSPTKRCGKSNLIYLIMWLVRRGYLTSGVGITSAVVFRLNDEHQPTLLIDEAEKLRSRNSAGEIISLLNAGHRRGQQVQRCVGKDGDFSVRNYDAFGFRVVGLIGRLWDTLSDRSIIVRLQRKPKKVRVRRFHGPAIDRDGAILARKIVRWVNDHRQELLEAEERAVQPDWLNDRECDNWSALFASAEVAGGEWPARIVEASHVLSPAPGEDGDLGEKLIHDVRRVFENVGNPEVIQSGQLAMKLGNLETSPWGDYRGGKGISTHKLAAMLRPFDVEPDQRRTTDGDKVRGYWLADLLPVFDRYPPPAEVGQLGQPTEDAASGSPTSRPRSSQSSEPKWDGENPHQNGGVPLVPVRAPQGGENPFAFAEGDSLS